MEKKLFNNKSYLGCNIFEDTKLFSDSYYNGYEVSSDLLPKLSKSLGFSYELFQTINSLSPEAASKLVSSMSKQSKHEDICLLVDEVQATIINYSLEAPRFPLLNDEFIHRTLSMIEASGDLSISEIYYDKDDTISTVLVRKKEPITVKEVYKDESVSIDYHIGVLLVNDELTTTSSRLVVYINSQPVYLPSSYYNSTASRYRRSTQNSSEALELLLLRVIEDLRDNTLYDKIYNFHFKYRYNKNVCVTYEEYNSLLKKLMKIPTIIEDNTVLSSMIDKKANFERKYPQLDAKNSSYIWRCTAMSDMNTESLVSLATDILNSLEALPVEYFETREMLGTYISTDRIASEIAIEDE